MSLLKKTSFAVSCLAVFLAYGAYTIENDVAVVSTLEDLQSALDNDDVSIVKVTKTLQLTNGTYLCSSVRTATGKRKVVQVMEPFLPESGKVTVSGDSLVEPTIVQGENDYNLFTVPAGATVTISNLTLKGGFTGSVTAGYTGSTGGIDNYGSLQLIDTVITQTGTALLNRPGASSVLVDCNIVRNANWFGGGILNLGEEENGSFKNGGTVILDRCSLTENESLGSSHGGGAAENQGLMCLNNCVVANNASTEIGGGINNCKGGTLYVMNSTFTGNVTTSKEYDVSAGGAIGNAGGAGHVYIVNSILANNGYDNGNYVSKSCLGRYDDSTDPHACKLVNTVIGATAGMDRIDATNSSAHVDGLFSGYAESGIVAAGGQHNGYSSDFPHPNVIDKKDEYAYAPVMVQVDTNHYLCTLSVATYFDYSTVLSGGKPSMAYALEDGKLVTLGPDVAAANEKMLVDVTFDGGSRVPANAIGAVAVKWKTEEEKPSQPGIFEVRLGEFTGGRVSGVTIYGDSYISNSMVTVHAVADSAHYLDGWIINKNKVEDSEQQYVFTFSVYTNITITPVFAPVVTQVYGARQRYPWNNLVDIDYSVSEEDAVKYRLVFIATYEEGGVTNTIQLRSFVRNDDVSVPQRLGDRPDLHRSGDHRVTWDSAADGVRLKGKKLSYRVLACEGDER